MKIRRTAIKGNLYLGMFLSLMTFVYPADTFPQSCAIGWYAFDMGFALPSSVNTIIKSAAGQTFVGFSAQGNVLTESGFLVDTLYRGQIMSVDKEDGEAYPLTYSLGQNYPNPFNPQTVITFTLPKPEYVKISVYNTLGQRILILLDKPMQTGRHQIEFTAPNLASGIYFYRIEAGEFRDVKRMVLMK